MIVDKIYHIADIHIRNYQRHTEYNAVFKKLYTYIKKTKTPNSVIYLAGDIVHQKTDLSPELVSMVGKFLKSLADMCTTIIICGNHDANLNNSSRLDTLSPIIEALKHKRILYWKETGVYKISPESNVSFGVHSVFDNIDKWPNANSINNSDIKIALHHGSVHGSLTDMNHIIENDSVTLKNFIGYDYILLGDIHKHQYLNDKKTAAYAGSLIQQNYGESIENHGLIVWDLINKTNEFVHIENDIAYSTITFEDNVLVTPDSYLKTLPKYLRLRVKHTNTDLSVIYDYLDKLKNAHTFKEYSLRRITDGKNTKMADLTIGNVRDIEFQNKLITDYLTQIDDIDNDIIDGVRHINRKINSEINDVERNARNTTWKLVSLKFDNMFSYGSGNYINFTNLSGVQGIFAPNASGKSSLLEVLLFGLFDKSSKTYRADEVMNNKKNDFYVEVSFDIEGEIYTISRRGISNSDRKVRVLVDFYNNTESLKGKDRDETNRIIRSYIGTYDDFMLTALSTQTDNRNFIFKTQRERKELLYSFLDLKLFTDLYNNVKNHIKETRAVINNLTSNLDLIDGSELLNNISQNEIRIEKYKKNIVEKESINNDLNKKLKENLLKINNSINSRSIEQINNDINAINIEIDNIKSKLPELKNLIKSNKNEINNIGIVNVNIDKYEHVKSDLNKQNKIIADLTKRIIDKCNIKNNVKKQIELLSTHKYDPNCEYCINNEFVIEANKCQNLLPQLNSELRDLQEQYNEIKDKVSDNQSLLLEFESQINLKNRYTQLKSEMTTLLMQADNLKLKYINLISQLQQYNDELNKYNEYQNIIKYNKELYTENINIDAEIKSNTESIRRNEIAVHKLEIDNKLYIERLKNNNKHLNELNTLQTTLKSYELYANAVSPTGVPYMLLTKVLPVIENEVNQLLHGVCEFTAEFSHDEKSIYCHLNYNNDNTWPVELSSGMERFIMSIVSRVALIEVTSLSRPNFIAIDEGFGVLDAENISNVYVLFDKIKEKFDFILCITHLDSFKDVADKNIEITKDGEYSIINVE